MKKCGADKGVLVKLCLVGLILAFCLPACAPKSPTPTTSATPSLTSTETSTPTLTSTRTLRPTVTSLPSHTSTITNSPFPSDTPIPTETPAPLRPAQLFNLLDAEGAPINWSYARLTSYKLNTRGQVKSISAFLAFQLMDRAIHRVTIKAFDRDITVYSLNVQHQFTDQLQPLQLVIGAVYGSDVDVHAIPAGGSSYTLVRLMTYYEGFDALGIHNQVNVPETQRRSFYQEMPLLDLQALLPTLPDQLIVLADHAILVDKDGWQQLYNDITSVSYLAARYLPFVQLDEYDRIVGPSPEAVALREFFLYGTAPTISIPTYSSQVLVFMTHLRVFGNLRPSTGFGNLRPSTGFGNLRPSTGFGNLTPP
jgi:hypothetical protein